MLCSLFFIACHYHIAFYIYVCLYIMYYYLYYVLKSLFLIKHFCFYCQDSVFNSTLTEIETYLTLHSHSIMLLMM